jgi:diguanylate cyclase (GGDEF)-like protein
MWAGVITTPALRTEHGPASARAWMWVVLRALGLAAIYAGIYELITVETSFGTSVGATLWPASGVTVSMLVLRPRREWPVYLVAIGLADFMMDVHCAGFSAKVSIGLAVANCGEPWLSAALLRKWIGGVPDLSRLRDLGLFYLAAAAGGPLLSATVSSVWQWALVGQPIWPFGPRWYVGDALGAIVVAPVIIGFVRAGEWSRPSLRTIWVFAGGLALLALALPWHFAAGIGLPFLVIPAVSVIGLRLGTRAAALAVLVVGLLVETLTTIGVGAFSGGGAFTGLLAVQTYLVACSASGLMAAALMAGLVRRDEMALHDSLTGLANRRLLSDRMSVASSHLARAPGSVGIVFIDLDDFKRINDDHGHAVGDHVLVETARRLQSVVRDEDTIARIGGDEFVILVSRIGEPEYLPGLVERVEDVITQEIAGRGRVVKITASVGYTTTDRADERSEDVLARADHAMYAAKRTSRPL